MGQVEKSHSERTAEVGIKTVGVLLVPFSLFQTLFFFVVAGVLLLI